MSIGPILGAWDREIHLHKCEFVDVSRSQGGSGCGAQLSALANFPPCVDRPNVITAGARSGPGCRAVDGEERQPADVAVCVVCC